MITDLEATLTEKKQLTADVFELIFTLKDLNNLQFEPGQYLLLKILGPDGAVIKYKHYSINSAPSSDNKFNLLVKMIPGGVASEYLKTVEVGQTAAFRGPAGLFVLKDDPRPKLFIATGTGIAPINSILKANLREKIEVRDEKMDNEVRSESNNVSLPTSQIPPPTSNFPRQPFTLLWGLKSMKDVYYLDQFKAFTLEYPNFKFTIFLSRETQLNTNGNLQTGRVTKGIEDLFKRASHPRKSEDLHLPGRQAGILDQVENDEGVSISDFDIYISGDKDIVESLRQYVISLGADSASITFEKFV